MRRRLLLALALPWGAGCDRPSTTPARPSLVVGCRAILYDPDPTEARVFAWSANRRDYVTPSVGTGVIYLGSIPPNGPGEFTEARVRVLDGEQKDRLIFVPLSKVQPAGPMSP